MQVVKFGGSSVKNAENINKVGGFVSFRNAGFIAYDSPDRKSVV